MVVVSVLGRTSHTVKGSVGPSVSSQVVEVVPLLLDVFECVDVKFVNGAEIVVAVSDETLDVVPEPNELLDEFQYPDEELVYDGNPDTEVGEYIDEPLVKVLVGGTIVSLDETACPGFFPVGPFGKGVDVENTTPPLPVGVVCTEEDDENIIPPLPGCVSLELLDDVENTIPPLPPPPPPGVGSGVEDVDNTTLRPPSTLKYCGEGCDRGVDVDELLKRGAANCQ